MPRIHCLNGTISHSVNFPRISLGAKSAPKRRIAIAHRAQAGITDEFAKSLAAGGYDIAKQASETHGEVAFTLIDANSELDSSLVANIEAHESVLKARIL